jgi:hypothetical protein
LTPLLAIAGAAIAVPDPAAASTATAMLSVHRIRDRLTMLSPCESAAVRRFRRLGYLIAQPEGWPERIRGKGALLLSRRAFLLLRMKAPHFPVK